MCVCACWSATDTCGWLAASWLGAQLLRPLHGSHRRSAALHAEGGQRGVGGGAQAEDANCLDDAYAR